MIDLSASFCSSGSGEDALFDEVIGHIQEIIFGL